MNETADPNVAAIVAAIKPELMPWHTIGGSIVAMMPYLMILGIVVCVFYFRFARRRETEKTIRAAIERGQPLDLQVIEKLMGSERPPRPASFYLQILGTIMMAGGIGLAGMTIFLHGQDADTTSGLLAAGELIGVIGIGFLVAARLTKTTKP